MMVFGRYFQLMDDLVDLYGQKGREVVGKDIDEGKISALVLALKNKMPQKAFNDFKTLWIAKDKSELERELVIDALHDDYKVAKDVLKRAHETEEKLQNTLKPLAIEIRTPALKLLQNITQILQSFDLGKHPTRKA